MCHSTTGWTASKRVHVMKPISKFEASYQLSKMMDLTASVCAVSGLTVWPNADLPTSSLSLTVRCCYNVIMFVVLLEASVTHMPPPSVSISTVQLLRIYLNFSFLRIVVQVSLLVLILCHLKVVYVMPTFKFLWPGRHVASPVSKRTVWCLPAVAAVHEPTRKHTLAFEWLRLRGIPHTVPESVSRRPIGSTNVMVKNNMPPHGIKVYGRSGVKVAYTPKLGGRWRRVVSLSSRIHYALTRRLGEHQSHSEHLREEKNLLHCRESNRGSSAIQSVA